MTCGSFCVCPFPPSFYFHVDYDVKLTRCSDPSFTWAYKKMEDSVKYWESKGWTVGKAQKKSVKAD